MERSIREESIYPQRKRTPSFSSTLLDAIYHSIHESKSNLDDERQLGQFPTSPKQNNNIFNYNNYNPETEHKSCNKMKMNLHRAVMIEDWIENQSSHNSSKSSFSCCSSHSSSSSSGAMFSSLETGRTHKPKPKTEKQQLQKPKREGGFARTKLRALKIYGESLNRKVKQPISPGSRIATFLGYIFNSAGNVKKPKMCDVGAVEDVTLEHTSKSPCISSSESSISRRSCMSKTNKPSNGTNKRTVRFYPVSVIHRYTHENDPSLLPLPSSVRKMTRACSVKEGKKTSVVKENGKFIKGYQNSSNKFGFRGFYDDDSDDDDDNVSYSSSDLFELDHLLVGGRYQEELPVYETTNLETNKAIANGLHL
ncbi:hypothetical protein RJT34_14949 [Clitoria ternatea]|uniref:Uncharacterized protein n=1 Tax=Clitoria ternatea TaxID=43366 RepID=A0AAN9JTC3_CLITE